MKWTVEEGTDRERLDRHVARELGVPRHQIQAWIEAQRVAVDGEPRKASFAVEPGMSIEAVAPEPEAGTLVAETGDLRVIFEDAHLVILDKPAGLTVHPGSGRPTGTLVHRLLGRYPEIATVGSATRPGIVHRLDKDTTGLMVVARSALAYQKLTAALSGREMCKEYLALAYGRPRQDRGTIELPIGRHPQKRVEMSVRADGREARTDFRTLDSAEGIAWLHLRLHTGRTHQIRVHLRAIGHPLVGDPVYGAARWRGLVGPARALLAAFPRPALHAWRLGFVHPASGEALAFEAQLPADLASLWQGSTGRPLPELPQPLPR